MSELGLELIMATDMCGCIGKDNTIPWKCKEDMQLFKRITINHCVIMGRKTFESLPKPLVDRTNVVLSHSYDNAKVYPVGDVEVVETNSIKKAIKIARICGKKPIIIGGLSLYNEVITNSNKYHLMTIHLSKIDVRTQWCSLFFDLNMINNYFKHRIVDSLEYTSNPSFKYLKLVKA